MNFAWQTLVSLWRAPSVRRKIIITIALIALFRLLAHIPLVGVDRLALQNVFANNQLLGIIDLFSGGTLSRFSVIALGVGPYITASILFQVGGLIIPQLKEMQRESDGTRAQLNQWTRLLSVPIAVVQGVSVLTLLRSVNLVTTTQPIFVMSMLGSLVAGSLLALWLGELVTKHGVGNGVSVMIFAGIVSQVPASLAQTVSASGAGIVGNSLWLAVGLILLMVAVVYVSQAERRVPIEQARRARGTSEYGKSRSYLPLKVNQFGVMPIIFALPLLTLPVTIATAVSGWAAAPSWAIAVARDVQIWLNPSSTFYIVAYFALVFIFTFFAISVYFNPVDFSEDLKKSGTYIPTVRPGKPTAVFLQTILNRLAMGGGLYLALVAILPLLAQKATGISTLTVGGTGLLITVSVILEVVKSLESQIIHDEYDRYRDLRRWT